MSVANQQLERLMDDLIEKLMEDQRATTREQAVQRTKKRGSVQHLGEAKDAERMIDEEEEHPGREV